MDLAKKMAEQAKALARGSASSASPDSKRQKSGEDEQEKFDSLGDDVPGMLKMLFTEVIGVKSKIDGVSVTADQAKMTASQAMVVAEAAEAKAVRVEQQIKEVRVELESMKGADLKTSVEQIVNESLSQ